MRVSGTMILYSKVHCIARYQSMQASQKIDRGRGSAGLARRSVRRGSSNEGGSAAYMRRTSPAGGARGADSRLAGLFGARWVTPDLEAGLGLFDVGALVERECRGALRAGLTYQAQFPLPAELRNVFSELSSQLQANAGCGLWITPPGTLHVTCHSLVKWISTPRSIRSWSFARRSTPRSATRPSHRCRS